MDPNLPTLWNVVTQVFFARTMLSLTNDNIHMCNTYETANFKFNTIAGTQKVNFITSKTNGYANDINLANSVVLFHISKHDTYCMGIWSERQFAIRNCAVYTLIGFIISFYGVVFKTGLVLLTLVFLLLVYVN
jgi:hypothetical protein